MQHQFFLYIHLFAFRGVSFYEELCKISPTRTKSLRVSLENDKFMVYMPTATEASKFIEKVTRFSWLFLKYFCMTRSHIMFLLKYIFYRFKLRLNDQIKLSVHKKVAQQFLNLVYHKNIKLRQHIINISNIYHPVD
jgi:hypothetical protein